MSYYSRRQLNDRRKQLEAERKFGKPIMKDYRTGEWIPAHYVGGVLFKGRQEEKSNETIEIKRKIDIAGILKSKDIPGTVIRFIEEYEKTHPEEVWNNEAKKIYSTGGETLYQFRGKYYRGTRPLISRKNSSGRECGSYGEETRTEVTEKDAQAFIEEYENTHPEEIWEKEAEKIYSTGGEILYQFRGQYYRGTRPFISRKNSSGRECGSYGKETLQLMRDREENNITLSSIKHAIEYSKDHTI